MLESYLGIDVHKNRCVYTHLVISLNSDSDFTFNSDTFFLSCPAVPYYEELSELARLFLTFLGTRNPKGTSLRILGRNGWKEVRDWIRSW